VRVVTAGLTEVLQERVGWDDAGTCCLDGEGISKYKGVTMNTGSELKISERRKGRREG
jgi:hypothetical protein